MDNGAKNKCKYCDTSFTEDGPERFICDLCLIDVNICRERRIAIKVLERLAYELGNEDIFDKGWFRLEDIITQIVVNHI